MTVANASGMSYTHLLYFCLTTALVLRGALALFGPSMGIAVFSMHSNPWVQERDFAKPYIWLGTFAFGQTLVEVTDVTLSLKRFFNH